MAARLPNLLRIALLALLAAAAPAASLHAAEDTAAALDPAALSEADRGLREMERSLRIDETPAPDRLRDYLGRLPGVRDLANRCVGQNETALASVQAKLETLGEAEGVESPGVQQQRDALQRQQRQIEQQLQLCRVLRLRADELQDRVTALKQEQLTERLLQREAPAWAVIAENLRAPRQWWNTARLFLLRSSGLESISWIEATGLMGLILIGLGGGLYLRQPAFAAAARLPDRATITAGDRGGWRLQRFAAIAVGSIFRYTPRPH